MSEPAVIFGGAGFVGTHLARKLVGERPVISVDIAVPAVPVPGVQYMHGDVRRPIELPATDQSARPVVYNLAAVHRTPGHAEHEYFETNVAGAENVTAWATRQDARQILFTSSISVYGPTEERLDETSPLFPVSAYGKSKLRAEQIHLDWAGGDRRLVIVRPAVIFGSGENGNFTRLAKALALRRFVYPGRTDTIKACGYVKDLIASWDHAWHWPAGAHTFNFAYPDQYTIQDICESFQRVAGYRSPPQLPASMLKAANWALKAGRGNSRAQHLAERVAKVVNSTNIAPTRLQKSGFQWPTDLTSALEDWWRDEPVGVFQ